MHYIKGIKSNPGKGPLSVINFPGEVGILGFTEKPYVIAASSSASSVTDLVLELGHFWA